MDFIKIIIIYLNHSLILKCSNSFENYLSLNHPLLAVWTMWYPWKCIGTRPPFHVHFLLVQFAYKTKQGFLEEKERTIECDKATVMAGLLPSLFLQLPTTMPGTSNKTKVFSLLKRIQKILILYNYQLLNN